MNASSETIGGSDANVKFYVDGIAQWQKRYCAAYWSAGSSVTKRNLGILFGGDRSEALGINDGDPSANPPKAPKIVGVSRTTTGGGDHAFLCESPNGPLLDLNDEGLLHGGSGWTLSRAEAINNRGYIVGQGIRNGYTRGFILIPLE